MLGELMYQSHASYSACGLGSQGTDRWVADTPVLFVALLDHGRCWAVLCCHLVL